MFLKFVRYLKKGFFGFVGDCQGDLRVNALGIAFIITTLIVWLATFTPVFMVVDRLTAVFPVSAELDNVLRICNLAAGLCLICEVVAYLIWMFVSAFKREEQTYVGGYV